MGAASDVHLNIALRLLHLFGSLAFIESNPTYPIIAYMTQCSSGGASGGAGACGSDAGLTQMGGLTGPYFALSAYIHTLRLDQI